MGIPRNQSTGTTAESLVELAFKRWGWNVGRDDVDEGYDRIVTPDRSRYGGHRFLVQVKGTVKGARNGSIVAEVTTARLRQYLKDPIPVFIIRVMANDQAYWIHAQSWAAQHPDLLDKPGKARVRFSPGHHLTDRAAFERCLFDAIFEWGRNPEAAVEEKTRFLNSLDPRFGVRLTVSRNRTCHDVFARTEGATGHLSFTPRDTDENLRRLRDVIEFGVPAEVDVHCLQVQGSPLFAYIHPRGPMEGTLRIESNDRELCSVRLLAGADSATSVLMLTFDAILFRGSRGSEVSNDGLPHPLDLRLRFHVQDGQPRLALSLSARRDVISGPCLQDLSSLEAWADWATQVIDQGTFSLQVRYQGSTMTLPVDPAAFEQVEGFVYWIRDIGRLHHAARALDSAFTLPAESNLSEEDARDVAMVDQLVRGGRPAIVMHAFEFEPTQDFDMPVDATFLITTTIEYRFFDRVFGQLPVVMELSGYQFEPLSGTRKLRVTPRPGSTAHISRWSPSSLLPKPDATAHDLEPT